MSKPLTVNKLKKLCEEEIKNGNGEKILMTADDDEGNGYHYMWYGFSTIGDAGAEDFVDERIAPEDETMVIG